MLFLKKQIARKTLSACLLIGAVLTMAGCGTESGNVVQTAHKGAIALDTIKVGIPESTIKDASMTFVQDPNGSYGGKVQYLSRTSDANGGQYVVQVRDEKAFGVQVNHATTPVTKEVAMETLKRLLPPDTPPQTKVDESALKTPVGGEYKEVFFFGDDYKGEIVYKDQNAKEVRTINAWKLTTNG